MHFHNTYIMVKKRYLKIRTFYLRTITRQYQVKKITWNQRTPVGYRNIMIWMLK